MSVTASPAVIVTAGASGIGEAIVRGSIERGARVVAMDRDGAALARLREELGERMHPLVVDITDEPTVAVASLQAAELLGPIDQLHCVAGGGRGFGPIAELDVDDWDFTMSLTLRSCFLTLKHVAPRMADGGAIVVIASINARLPFLHSSAYSTAKGGVELLARNAALDFAPRLRLNAVLPGIVRTASTAGVLAGGPAVEREYTERSLLGRIANPRDVAGPALFLAGPEARHITGASLLVDAGTAISGYPDPRRHLERPSSEGANAA